MTNDPLYNRLLELSWRRPLTASEQAELRAWLAAHPEGLADWEAEAGLTKALDRLPDAPVASNFTARVLQAMESDAAAQLRQPRRSPWRVWEWRLRWLPKAAFAVTLVCLGLFSYRVGETVRQKQLVAGVEVVSDVSSLPSPQILQDFDAIRAMTRTPAPDTELLALLQ